MRHERPETTARVMYDYGRMGLAVFIREGGTILDFSEATVTRRVIAEGGAAESEAQPLVVSEEVARAVYEALADYFGHSAQDTRLLRKDYEAERARVDRALEALIRLAG